MLSFNISVIDDENNRNKFEQLYNSYSKQMFGLANSILKNSHDAEDVVHEVFYKIAQNHSDIFSRIKSDVDLRNYLLKSAKNTAISFIRMNKTFLELDEIAESDSLEFSDDKFLDMICAKIDAKILLEVMDSLENKYREVLYYHFVLELSVAEVADLLDRNINTVKKQLVRGKSKLLEAARISGTIY